MLIRILLVLFSIGTGLFATAQTGRLTGKIIDEKTSGILAGASVITEELQKGVFTSVEGTFVLNLPPGKYTLVVSYSGYHKKTISNIEIGKNEISELNISLESAAREIEAVVIRSTQQKESVSSLFNYQRTQPGMSDGIAAEMIRKSPDRNTGAVLKRVSGASVQENKFVVVRGLADRYNAAMINNSILPSSEPDRKAFSFDIIPSTLVDNIIISKTASPDLPGDFSGGMVQVNTRDVPTKNFFDISYGLGGNTKTTFSDFKRGVKGRLDILGFDDGTRNMPDAFPRSRVKYNSSTAEDQFKYTRSFSNNFGLRRISAALPAQNLQLSFGNRKDFEKGGYTGTVLALTYQFSQSLSTSNRKDYESEGVASYDLHDNIYKTSTTLGALANFSFVKGNNKFSFKNLFNRSFENAFTTRTGYNFDNDQEINMDNGTTANDLLIKTLISSQLEGEHRPGNNQQRIIWNLNFTSTNRDQPDLAVISYFRPISSQSTPYSVILRPQNTFRFFSNLNENATGGTFHYSLPFRWMKEKQTLKAGYNNQYKLREFQTRFLTYKKSPYGNFDETLLLQPPDRIFNAENFHADGFLIEDITSNTDRYSANSMLHAGYLMLDNHFGDHVRLVWGIRAENFLQQVKTRDLSGRMVYVDNDNFDLLPSACFTYKISRRQNLKLAASQTVSRPEFRELANFSYYDFVTNSSIIGNPLLRRSLNSNVDLRYEIFPSPGEIFSFSGFYKSFKNPIEQAILSGSVPSNRIRTFINSRKANTYGAEMEIRKSLGFISDNDFWKNIILYSNIAVIRSSVSIASLNLESKERPLQGQSPYLVNAGLMYAASENTFAVSLLYNRTGERIADVGFAGYPDIYERARDILDLQLSTKMGRKGELKLNISDLLNQQAIFYQNLGSQKKFNKSQDQVVNAVRYGANISLNYTWHFDIKTF